MSRGALPGERRGGRAKGTPNRKTEEQVRAIQESGVTPLDYMLSVLRDKAADEAVRLDAAGRAAPYVHPRLTAAKVEWTGSPGYRTATEMSDAELMATILRSDPVIKDRVLEFFYKCCEEALSTISDVEAGEKR